MASFIVQIHRSRSMNIVLELSKWPSSSSVSLWGIMVTPPLVGVRLLRGGGNANEDEDRDGITPSSSFRPPKPTYSIRPSIYLILFSFESCFLRCLAISTNSCSGSRRRARVANAVRDFQMRTSTSKNSRCIQCVVNHL